MLCGSSGNPARSKQASVNRTRRQPFLTYASASPSDHSGPARLLSHAVARSYKELTMLLLNDRRLSPP